MSLVVVVSCHTCQTKFLRNTLIFAHLGVLKKQTFLVKRFVPFSVPTRSVLVVIRVISHSENFPTSESAPEVALLMSVLWLEGILDIAGHSANSSASYSYKKRTPKLKCSVLAAIFLESVHVPEKYLRSTCTEKMRCARTSCNLVPASVPAEIWFPAQ